MEPSLFNAMERGFTTRVSESSSVRSVFRPRKIRSTGSDRKSTRLNSSHSQISYAVFCLKKKKNIEKDFLCEVHNAFDTYVGFYDVVVITVSYRHKCIGSSFTVRVRLGDS